MSEERDQRGRLPIRRRTESEPTDLASALADRELLRLECDQLRAALAEALEIAYRLEGNAAAGKGAPRGTLNRLAELRKLVGR